MKIVKTNECDGITKKAYPQGSTVKFLIVETDWNEYVGSFVAGVYRGSVLRSNKMEGVNLTDSQIKRACQGHVDYTNSKGWWLN